MLRIPAASILGLGLSAGAAAADLNADDVWRDWQALLADLGYTVRGAPERAGNRLVIPDLGLTQTMPDADGRIDIRLGRIAFEERGDGTVAVIYPESMPMAIAVMPAEGEAMTATLALRHDGLEVTASGTPERVGYDYAADALSLDLGQVTIDGEAMDMLGGEVELAALAGRSAGFVEEGIRRMEQDITAGPVRYSIALEDPQSGSAFTHEGAAESFAYDGTMSLPLEQAPDDLAAALDAGLRIATRLEFGPGESRFSSTEDGVTSRGTSRSAGTGLEMTLSAAELSLGVRSDEVAATMDGSEVPFPLAYEAERAGLDLVMPVARDDAAQPFGLSLDFRSVTLSDDLWTMLDPEGVLPREPANLAVDLSGTGKLSVDLFDETAMAALEAGDSRAFAPERLVLDTLMLELAGAKLTGAGAVDIEPEAGADFPPAQGKVDLRLEGGNGLLDRLVAMGLLPEEQAMTVRMMAAMFAQPVEGDDTLTSSVEIRKDGSVLVNGQRMR